VRIAVCIPVYRPPAWYEVTCLASVMRAMCRAVRAGHDVSLLIGADGCEEARARTLAFGLPVLWSPRNAGCFVMRNSLHETAGDVDAYAYWDADDWMHPEHIILHAEALPSAGMTTPRVVTLKPGRADEKICRYESSSGGMVSRAAWDAIGGYIPARVHGDADALARVEMAGGEIVHVDTVTRRRYVWARSLTRDAPTAIGSDYRTDVRAAAASVRASGVVRIPRVVVPLTEIQP
jgi:hypothetical protein